ncbi:MAG: phosphoglycerate kinase [Candidatus Saccharibacteria bacterium]
MLSKKTIRDIDINGKTVLIRVDYNTPFSEHGVITDDYRIRQTLPTITYALDKGAKVILISHLGRPGGKPDPALSLKPAAIKLAKLIDKPVAFIPDCIGPDTSKQITELSLGSVALLENLRFHPQEESNDENFAKELASYADFFVQDGFGVVYRKHASVEAVTHFLPSVAGLLLEKEVNAIQSATQNPQKPLAVVIGGLKVSDKIKMVEHYCQTADYVAVIGAMANTFLMADGVQVGSSQVEPENLENAKNVIANARKRMKQEPFTFYLPTDVVVAKSRDASCLTRVVDVSQHTWSDIISYPKTPQPETYTIQPEEMILDIGPISAASIAGSLKMANTALWNGMAGVTEIKGINGAFDPFAHGTKVITDALSGGQNNDMAKPFTIIAGGDTVAYIESIDGLRDKFSYVSTGGGAALELMAGNKLPGIEALENK